MTELPEKPEKRQSIGTFLRRLIWRRRAGPLSAEAELEVRELTDEREPRDTPPPGPPPA